MRRAFLFIVVLLSCLCGCEGAHRCVWAKGKVECQGNPDAVLSMEIRLYDRDGGKTFGWLDSDDLMGLTVPEPDGSFILEGCGDDHDWLPWVKNIPEPYITIFHYCNDPEKGEEIIYENIIETFTPETYRPPTFVMDN